MFYSLVYLISTPLEVKQPQKLSTLRSEFSKDERLRLVVEEQWNEIKEIRILTMQHLTK